MLTIRTICVNSEKIKYYYILNLVNFRITRTNSQTVSEPQYDDDNQHDGQSHQKSE